MMHYVLLVNKLDPTWKDETSLQSTAEGDADLPTSTVRRSCDADHCQLVCSLTIGIRGWGFTECWCCC